MSDFEGYQPTIEALGQPRSEENLALPCDRCGAEPSRIVELMKVTSFVVFTQHRRWHEGLCRTCCQKAAGQALAQSALLGWWGIPWGLMTLNALSINLKALFRWSNLPRATTVLAAVASFSVPIAVGAIVWISASERREAEKTGDWVDETVVQLTEEGHRKMDAGEPARALESYLEAHRRAPNSSTTNFSVAEAYLTLGEYEEALGYSNRALEIAPLDVAHLAQNGWLEAVVHGLDAPTDQLEQLRRLPIESLFEAGYAADFFDLVDEDQDVVRVTKEGLEIAPGDTYLQARLLNSLVNLDQLTEAEALAASLPAEVDEPLAYPLLLLRLRQDPQAALPEMRARWEQGRWNDENMAEIVDVIARTPTEAEIRREVHRYLLDSGTSGDLWFTARAWWNEEEWPEALDARLEAGLAMGPGLARLATWTEEGDHAAVRGLARQLRELDHPLAEVAQQIYVGVGLKAAEPEARAEAIASWCESHPDDRASQLRLARTWSAIDGEKALEILGTPGSAKAEDPAWEAAADLLRSAVYLDSDQPEKAIVTLASADVDAARTYLGSSVDILAMEISWLAGATTEGQKRRDEILAPESDASGSSQAVALLFRWAEQTSRGAPTSFGSDVDGWLARWPQPSEESDGATAMGIYAAQGIVAVDEARGAVAPEYASSIDLVALFADAQESGPSRSSLQSLAERSKYRSDLAAGLSRWLLEARSQPAEAGV